MPPNQDTRGAPDWLRPAAEQGGLNYYVEVLRERIWMVVAIMLITLVAAGAYLFTADDVYEGEARLLITPASGDDALMSSLGVLRASNDPTRDIETVATLATTVEVAERARRNLESDSSARSLLRRVDAEPIASSSLVSIIARGPTAAEAAELANAFADAVAQDRTAALHEAVNEVLPQLRSQLQSGDSAGLTPDSRSCESDPTPRSGSRRRPSRLAARFRRAGH